MLTRLITLSAVILSVTSAQQLGSDDNSEPSSNLGQTAWDLPEKAWERVDQFYGDGVDLNEMVKDLTVFINMYKSRYTNILPVNFRHLIMNNITDLMDELITPYVDLVALEDQQYKSYDQNQLKENMKLIFIGRFWFSNMAYFNEQKRYLKLNQQAYNDDIVAEIIGELTFNLTGISLQASNQKIKAGNFDLVHIVQNLKQKLSDDIWTEFNYISKMLIQESTWCVEDFFKQAKKRDLLNELEIIADSSLGKHEEQAWEDNFKPFAYTDSPTKYTQQYAYSMSYEFPESCFASDSRNRAVHPAFESDQKDKVFLQWIEMAFERRGLDFDRLNEEGYEYLKNELFSDTEKTYWNHYYKNDFENTLERKIKKNQYEYLDAMSYETYGDSWVNQEGREYDLELEDTELDHIWTQNQFLKECLKYSVDEWNNVGDFFANQENYDQCLKMAPDIIYFDDRLLIQEQQAFQENMRKYEAFHQHKANINRKDIDDIRPGRRDLRASSSRPNHVHEHATFRTTNTTKRDARQHSRNSRRNSRRNDQTMIQSIKSKLSNLFK